MSVSVERARYPSSSSVRSAPPPAPTPSHASFRRSDRGVERSPVLDKNDYLSMKELGMIDRKHEAELDRVYDRDASAELTGHDLHMMGITFRQA